MDKLRLIGTPRKATEDVAGKHVYGFVLAALSDLYNETSNPDDFEFSEENGYDTFENYASDEPTKGLKRPLTVMRDAKTILATAFASLVVVINETGRVPPESVRTHLANVQSGYAGPVRLMIFVAEELWPTITSGALERDFGSVKDIQTKLQAFVRVKANIEGCSEEIARIFVRFLKCVAWHTAQSSVEHKTTLNGHYLRSMIRVFGGCFPKTEVDEDLMEYFKAQADWAVKADGTARKTPAKKVADAAGADEGMAGAADAAGADEDIADAAAEE